MACAAGGVALLLGACGSSRGHAGPSSGAPVRGGTLHVALSAAPDCLDPGVAITGNERAIARPLVDSLVTMDRAGRVRPWLASRWSVNWTATAYTFRLRPHESFSDGTPVTATAVRDTLDYLKHKLATTSPRAAGYLAHYTGTTVVNRLTARVDFSAPSAQFLAGASTTTLGILSTSSAARTPAQRCDGRFVGSGPFTLKSYLEGQAAVLERRAGYDWPPATAAHRGPAYLSAIDFQVVDTSVARDGELQSGQTDVALDVATQDLPGLRGSGVSAMFGTQAGMPAAFIVNTTHPGLDELAVRRAIMIGFARTADVRAILGRYYGPARSVLTHNFPEFKDESSHLRFDPPAARRLLQDAGWTPGPGGIRRKDGVKLDLEVSYSSSYGPYYTSLLQLFQQQMQDIGVGITLKNLTKPQLVQDGLSGSFDLHITTLTDADPDILRSNFEGQFPQASALKASGITALLARSATEANLARRTATYAQIQDRLIGNGFVIPFFEGGQLVGYADNVHGLSMDFQSWLQFYDTWLSR